MFEIFLTALISLLIGIGVSKYYSRRRMIYWKAVRRKIIDPTKGRYPESVQITIGGKAVENLNEWRIAIWNAGNNAVPSNDFLGKDPSFHRPNYRKSSRGYFVRTVSRYCRRRLLGKWK